MDSHGYISLAEGFSAPSSAGEIVNPFLSFPSSDSNQYDVPTALYGSEVHTMTNGCWD